MFSTRCERDLQSQHVIWGRALTKLSNACQVPDITGTHRVNPRVIGSGRVAKSTTQIKSGRVRVDPLTRPDPYFLQV